MTGKTPSADEKRPQAEEMRVGWKLAGLASEVAVQTAGGAVLGWCFDLWRGTGPTGVIVGACIGIVVGLWTLIKGSLKLNKQLDAIDARRREQRKAGGGQPPLTPAQNEPDDRNDDWDDDKDDDEDDWR